MNDPEKRTCPYCAEVIKPQAKLCPRCRQWLTLKSFRHPVVLLFLHGIPAALIFVGFMTLLFSLLNDFQNPKPYYSEFPDSLKIIESHMNWVQTKDGLRIFVAGVLTNSSPINWKDAEFDCRFFDTNGIMVDATTSSGRATVRPHDDSAFRVSIVPTAPTNSYASFRVSVGNARNAKSLY